MSRFWGIARTILAPAALSVTVACTASVRSHGYVPTEAELAEVQPGTDTRETVAAKIGRPTASGLRRDTAWYYVESKIRQFGAQPPREIERQIVAVSFTDAGTVANIERFGLQDGRVVTLSRRVTENPTSEQPYLQQLLGRVGAALFQ